MSILQKNRDVNSGINVLLCTGRLKINPAKNRKRKDGDKSAVAILKDARQLGCVFQDTEPSESSLILRMSTKVLRPIRRVRFSKATLRHANIREIANPHQRSPYAPTFEDRSQDETEWQERGALEAAWRLAKKISR